MRPIIKWPGGKAGEYKHIENVIPNDISNYIEPFFGGGGIFFKLAPKKAIINDINCSLMDLYRFVKEENKKIFKSLHKIAQDWENLTIISESVYKNTKKYKNNIEETRIKREIEKIKSTHLIPKLINGQDQYWALLTNGLMKKLRRITDLEVQNGIFSDKDFYSQIEAVTKGAYYYYLRDKFIPSSKEEEIAQFYFIREYCYGSMFRFNKNGKFNIPYGGASYNNKDFSLKVNEAFSTSTRNLLKNTQIFCLDFKDLFKKIVSQIDDKSFCFFDPPYDTVFSEYDHQSFGKKDQEDLASLFGKLKCRALMIIKKTDFILSLYEVQKRKNSKISIKEYEKNYTYNVRGRNKRDVTHLLISNYP